jgi:hypothetical protein
MQIPRQVAPVLRNTSPNKSCVTGLKLSTLIDFWGCVDRCKRTPTFAPRTRSCQEECMEKLSPLFRLL